MVGEGKEKTEDEGAPASPASKTSPTETGESRKKLKMTITNWNTLAYWKWLANDDKCGICRTAFDGCCADCKIPGDDCPLVWGVCSHCFHMHCIMKWLSSQQTTQHTQQCPMCRQDWALKSD